MTEQNASRKNVPSLKLTEDPSDGQGQIVWNGNYGKYWAQVFRTQAMGLSRSTTSSLTSLAKLGKLLLKYTEITGTKMNPSIKQSEELVDSNEMDGE